MESVRTRCRIIHLLKVPGTCTGTVSIVDQRTPTLEPLALKSHRPARLVTGFVQSTVLPFPLSPSWMPRRIPHSFFHRKVKRYRVGLALFINKVAVLSSFMAHKVRRFPEMAFPMRPLFFIPFPMAIYRGAATSSSPPFIRRIRRRKQLKFDLNYVHVCRVLCERRANPFGCSLELISNSVNVCSADCDYASWPIELQQTKTVTKIKGSLVRL